MTESYLVISLNVRVYLMFGADKIRWRRISVKYGRAKRARYTLLADVFNLTHPGAW